MTADESDQWNAWLQRALEIDWDFRKDVLGMVVAHERRSYRRQLAKLEARIAALEGKQRAAADDDVIELPHNGGLTRKVHYNAA
jgi:hypothetical protein